MVSPVLGTAATLGLTVGAGYVFGPVGAVAGALLGNFLFGGGGANVEGPRLGDLTVGASTWGNVIPVAYATQKIAGTIIWAPPIEEQKDTRKVGGGIVRWRPEGHRVPLLRDFAVAFAEGATAAGGPAAGLVRLWAGEKLLADFRAARFFRGPERWRVLDALLRLERPLQVSLLSRHVGSAAGPADPQAGRGRARPEPHHAGLSRHRLPRVRAPGPG